LFQSGCESKHVVRDIVNKDYGCDDLENSSNFVHFLSNCLKDWLTMVHCKICYWITCTATHVECMICCFMFYFQFSVCSEC